MRTILALAILSLASTASAQWSPGITPTGRMQFGPAPMCMPPLDAPMWWQRTIDEGDLLTSGTHSILALYAENETGAPNAWTWPLYVELRTRHTHPSDGVGVYSRLRNEGDGWAAAFHAEAVSTGNGTTIGANIEAISGGAHVIGLNVQAVAAYESMLPARGVAQAINIQNASTFPLGEGIRFDACEATTGILFDAASTGERAIAIEGDYTVGIYSDAPIVVTRGTPIALEETRAITVTYEPGKIVFRNRSRILGYLVTGADASGGRLN